MNTRNLIPALTVLCVVSLAWFVLPGKDPPTDEPLVVAGSSPDIRDRLALIEDELARERDARIVLQARYEDVLTVLGTYDLRSGDTYAGSFDDVQSGAPATALVLTDTVGDGDTIVVPVAESNDGTQRAASALSPRQVGRARVEAIMDGREREFLAEQLVVHGFSTEEAEHIAKRESELRLESLYADYKTRRIEAEKARNAQTTADGTAPIERLSTYEQLRRELGDENYAKYLESSGRSTSVGVRSVMESSPAQMSGLQPGDEILSYNGERVFSIQEINEKTVEGMEGQSVLLEVDRNGEDVQVVVPRGPLGITTGRGGSDRR